jgi:site-specific DNA-methyltransferase (adenine-specific)
MRGAFKFYCHSSESMPEVEDEAVALTVTSPPYWNAIDYDRHSEDSSQWYRTRRYQVGFEGYESYLELMERVFREVLRVTRPGGHCAIVIGTILLKGCHIPVPFDFVTRMTKVGWLFHQDIIWHKCTGGVKRAGVTIQKPYPGYFYPNIMTEYILVFRKPGQAMFKGRSEKEREESCYPIDSLFTRELANNVWHIAPVPPNYLNHPCPFPEEIPFRLVNFYSYKGDFVLDPFLGSAQTAKVALHLGRKAIGYELLEKYIRYAEQRIGEPLALRPDQLIARFDKTPLNGDVPSENRNGQRRLGRRRTSRPKSHSADLPLFASKS